MLLWVMNRKKRHVVLLYWPVCERVEEYHIFTAVRSWDFSRLFTFYCIFCLQFVLCGTIDIPIVLRYNDSTKVKED